MGDVARFTKQGLRDVSWNEETKQYEVLERETYVPCLRQECEIEDGVTLKDIFAAVGKDELLKGFLSMYSWCSHIDEFLEDVKKMPTEQGDGGDEPFLGGLDYLEIYWDSDAFTYSKKGLKPTFNMNACFCGWGPPDEYAKEKGEDKSSCWVSYVPMYHLAHLPVKLNMGVEIVHTDQTDPSTDHGLRTKVLFKGEQCFSLLEVLDAIFEDISWHGGPEGNAAFVKESQKVVAKCMEDLEGNTVPMEDNWEDILPKGGE